MNDEIKILDENGVAHLWSKVDKGLNDVAAIANTRSDWNQNDSTQIDYIKNRPFYDENEVEEIEIIKDLSLIALSDAYAVPVTSYTEFELGSTYKVIINDKEFITTCEIGHYNLPVLGNVKYSIKETWDGEGEPYYLWIRGGILGYFAHSISDLVDPLYLSVYQIKEKIHQVESKFIKNLVGRESIDKHYYYNDSIVTGDLTPGLTHFSQTGAEVFNGKTNLAIGRNSHAEGDSSIALGECSHAMGFEGKAFGYSSFAGAHGTSYGFESFSFGPTCRAIGNYSFAINNGCSSFGDGSFTMGEYTTASKNLQFVCGSYNIPEDFIYQDTSYAVISLQGNENRIVYLLNKKPVFNKNTGTFQNPSRDSVTPTKFKDLKQKDIFILEYNEEDTEIYTYFKTTSLYNTTINEKGETIYHRHLDYITPSVEDKKGKYAFIVGNGTSDTERSNAYTLDWDGNAWFAGSGEFDSIILRSSTEGSSKKFKITVNDEGMLETSEIQ